MRTTEAMRKAWHPPCKLQQARFTFHTGVSVIVDARTLPVWDRVDRIMALHGYGPRAGQTWGYACRAITGGKGYSLHAYGIAVDVNSLTNPYGPKLVTDMPMEMVEAIEGIRTVDGLPVVGWGGRYRGNRDAMHFEVICTPAQLTKGLAPYDTAPEEDDMFEPEDAERLERAELHATAAHNIVEEIRSEVKRLAASNEKRSKEMAAILDHLGIQVPA